MFKFFENKNCRATITGSSTLTATFKPTDDPQSLPQDFKSELQTKINNFRTKFTQIFNLQNVNENFVEMGRYGFANMIGSVSYWTGYCQVGSPCLPYNQAINYGPLTLYSGIPSRPYYPRGFLWDEGFHNLLMRKFRPELSLDIVASWLDMIDSEGWIPREVVLDSEAHRRAPPLLFEDSTVANPPMFIYLIGKLMEDSAVVSAQKDRLIRIFPRLKLLYTWLKDIQKGPKEGSCQWQGRNGTTDLELNPGTTPSGLDDYPRASHPDPEV
uniref:Glycosyl hydrolase family 63 C-terminal domain-containing protein n=1 Tax=Panagrolaimus sp. PS1159 TaxID=55785 RepID=A0AC35G0G3_9BILA